jgi:hypothetical protein
MEATAKTKLGLNLYRDGRKREPVNRQFDAGPVLICDRQRVFTSDNDALDCDTYSLPWWKGMPSSARARITLLLAVNYHGLYRLAGARAYLSRSVHANGLPMAFMM